MDKEIQRAGRPNDPGDREQQAQHLAELLRSGEIEKSKVEFAAFLGFESAKALTNEEYDYEVFENGRLSTKFFEMVIEKFGIQAYLSLLKGPIEEFLPVHKAYLQHHDIELSDKLDVLLGIFEEVLASKSDSFAMAKTLSKGTQLLGDIEEELNTLWDSLPEDIPDDYFFGRLSLKAARHLTRDMFARTLDLSTGSSKRKNRYLTQSVLDEFQVELLNFDIYPHEYLFDSLPNDVQNLYTQYDITTMDSLDTQIIDERSEFVLKIILSMMKRSALNWALKDVK